MKRKATLTPTNVRFHPRMLSRLTRLAKTLNLNVSDLVRVAVSAKLSEWETQGVTFQAAAARTPKKV